jgi:hypothetical protein
MFCQRLLLRCEHACKKKKRTDGNETCTRHDLTRLQNNKTSTDRNKTMHGTKTKQKNLKTLDRNKQTPFIKSNIYHAVSGQILEMKS